MSGFRPFLPLNHKPDAGKQAVRFLGIGNITSNGRIGRVSIIRFQLFHIPCFHISESPPPRGGNSRVAKFGEARRRDALAALGETMRIDKLKIRDVSATEVWAKA